MIIFNIIDHYFFVKVWKSSLPQLRRLSQRAHCLQGCLSFLFVCDKGWNPLSVGSREQRLVCVELLTSGLILPQLVWWYWSSPSDASESDQLEPKWIGQLKQACCFGFYRLSVWYSDGGVSVLLALAASARAQSWPCTCCLPSVSGHSWLWNWCNKTFISDLREAFSFFFFIKLRLAVPHAVM